MLAPLAIHDVQVLGRYLHVRFEIRVATRRALEYIPIVCKNKMDTQDILDRSCCEFAIFEKYSLVSTGRYVLGRPDLDLF